jgi:preprotein translocase subunit SecE
VARNRKRAKERRARRPQPVATARDQATPGPIGQAAPDVELADAQLALGRPELADDNDAEPMGRPELEDENDAEPLAQPDGEFGEGPSVPGVFPERAQVEAGELDRIEAPASPARPGAHNRLINFLQGSWRELQRVQWPDRRQVMQATGVVIGFVIVAGAFLGVADFLAGKLVPFILK